MRYLVFIPLSILLIGSASASSSLLVKNHSFEAQALGFGSFFYSPTPVTDWTSTGPGGPDRGVWHTTAPGKDGLNIAFAYANNSVAQQLVASLEANSTYTFRVLLGRPGDNTRATVELYAGGTVAGGMVTGGTLLKGQTFQVPFKSDLSMDEYSFQYSSPMTGSAISQPLAIRIAGTTVPGESYVSFDNVRLDVEAVPEPATLLVAGLGSLAVALRRRKKS
ncbi:MAG: PEP-CTERM sorting domain-containing protein [Fimbriimonadaceae bacterium]|jgi:hypothetical protein|nr:PEP-CTERM sorting domain-containing protein [Fimbriimonadaceae bacterium]